MGRPWQQGWMTWGSDKGWPDRSTPDPDARPAMVGQRLWEHVAAMPATTAPAWGRWPWVGGVRCGVGRASRRYQPTASCGPHEESATGLSATLERLLMCTWQPPLAVHEVFVSYSGAFAVNLSIDSF